MDIKVDVYDASGNQIGQPLRKCLGVNIQRRLDAAGDIQLSFSPSDERAAKYLTYKRRVRVFVDDGQTMREIGSGIINDDDFSETASGRQLTFKGVDLLEELKYRNTLTNLRYDKQALNTVASNLIALVPGWTATCAIVNPITARFDGTSVLKALQTVSTKLSGQHLRLKQWNEVEIGAFGADIGLRIISPSRITSTMRKNDSVAFLNSIKITGRSASIANRLYVYGAGQSLDTALTLEHAVATRTVGLGYDYNIGSVIRNSRTHWYIEDATAIAEYGLIEKFVNYREIAPLSPAAVDVTAAAEALYDAVVEDLKRMKEIQTVYSVSLSKVKKAILPGDKVQLIYEGPIARIREVGGGVQPPRSIKSLFTVLTIKESFDSKHGIDLEISNIDQYPETLAKKVFTSIEDLKIYANQIQPSVTAYPYSGTINIDSSGSPSEQKGIVQFPVQNFAYEVDRVQMRVHTEVFEAYSKGAGAGGDHTHIVFENVIASIIDEATNKTAAIKNDSGGTSTISFYADTGFSGDLITFSSSGDHIHPSAYGVYRDTLYPGLLTIKVNGVVIKANGVLTDVTPVGDENNAYDATFDITPEILGKAGGFRGIHNIEISCAEGRGRVVVNFDASIHILPYKYVS